LHVHYMSTRRSGEKAREVCLAADVKQGVLLGD
jgi:hypothetical protein